MVMMPDVFDLLIYALQVPVKHPADDDHHEHGRDDGDQGGIFPG